MEGKSTGHKIHVKGFQNKEMYSHLTLHRIKNEFPGKFSISKLIHSSLTRLTWQSIHLLDLGIEPHLDAVSDTVGQGEIVSGGLAALLLYVQLIL